jgi:hypothetical protein
LYKKLKCYSFEWKILYNLFIEMVYKKKEVVYLVHYTFLSKLSFFCTNNCKNGFRTLRSVHDTCFIFFWTLFQWKGVQEFSMKIVTFWNLVQLSSIVNFLELYKSSDGWFFGQFMDVFKTLYKNSGFSGTPYASR